MRKMMKALVALFAVALAGPVLAHGVTLLPIETANMREGHREAAIARRAEFMKRMKGGLAVITSADRTQPNLYESYTIDMENKDFVFLSGIYDTVPPGHILVLNPGGKQYKEILYTDMSPYEAARLSGVKYVFPRAKFLEHMSSAITDYRNLRITQLRFKEVASDLSLGWGDGEKLLYVNYPHIDNLGEPPAPRLAFLDRIRATTSEVVFKDAAEIIDPMRVILDPFARKNMDRSIAITRAGLMEGMKFAKPGLTTLQVMETVDYVYRFHGATLGFATGVALASNMNQELKWESAAAEEAARKGDARIMPGMLVHFDTGAAMNHYSADVQRTVPADGVFTPEQRRIYQGVLDVQKAVIAAVKPGVYWKDLQKLAEDELRKKGGWDKSYTYGIGHFVGMETHEHGDYVGPLKPGMVIAIEQGAVVDGTRVAFEDEVLVTATGHEWLTRSIPIEIDEVEALRREPAMAVPKPLGSK